MASQIAHVVYGKKVRGNFKLDLDWKSFVIGTTFPDIRQIAGIKRSRLHTKNTVLENTPRKNSFEAGMYIHSYVDEKREKFLRSVDAYQILGDNPISIASAKLVEDEILYEKIDNWEEIIGFYDTVLEEETRLIKEIFVKKWHRLLKDYMSKKPQEKVWLKLVKETTVYADVANEIMECIKEIKKNERVVDILKEVYSIY